MIDIDVPTDLPWASLTNAGAAVLVLITVALFMRWMREQASEARAERETQRTEFTAALDRITKSFGDRVEAMSSATRESNERVEVVLRDLVAGRRAG